MYKKAPCIIALMLVLIALPAFAQMDAAANMPMPPGQGMPGGMMGGQGMMGGMGGQGMMGGGMCPMMGGGMGSGMSPMGMMGHGEMALDQCLMMHLQMLGLTDDQKQRVRTIITDYMKEKINLTSQIQIKEIDLHTLLMADNVDMRKVETQVRDINRLQGDLQLAGIRAFEAGKKVLTPAQRQMIGQVMMGCMGSCQMMGGGMSCPMMGGQGMMGGMSGPGGMAPGGQMPMQGGPAAPAPPVMVH